MPHTWATATTLAERLDQLANEAEAALETLLAHSSIEERFSRDDIVVVITPYPWRWGALDDDGLLALQDARAAVGRWRTEARAALEVRARELLVDFDDHQQRLDVVVDRSDSANGPDAPTREGVAGYVAEALAGQRQTLRTAGIASVAGGGRLLLVPDTNALYYNPGLEEWEGSEPATLVLVPPVVAEIDDHKDDARRSDRQEKARGLVRRMGEYQRRGDASRGVKLAGNLDYRIIGHEADPLPVDQLNVRNSDDAILAALLNLRRLEPQAPVLLITRDQGLVNKASARGVSVDRPPEPQTPPPERQPRRQAPQRGATAAQLPDVAIGHPGGSLSTTPLHELAEGEHTRLIRVEPRYVIENKGQTAVRQVETGVRTRDGREHVFTGYAAQLLGAGESSWVENVGSVPLELLDGVHPSAAFDGFIWWARFTTADGERWEVAYDAGTRTSEWHPAGSATVVRQAAPADPAPVPVVLQPEVLRGRIYPYQYAPAIQGTDTALVVRTAAAVALPTEPEPTISSDDEQLFVDLVERSSFEGWIREQTLGVGAPEPAAGWRPVDPTRSTIVSLLRPAAPMPADGWTLEARAQICLRPYPSIGPPGWGTLLIDAVVRPDSDHDQQGRPLALEELYALLVIQLTAVLDEITAPLVPRLTGSDLQLLAVAAVAIASGRSFSQFVPLRARSGWRQVEGAYDPTGAEWGPQRYDEIGTVAQRAEAVRGWLSRLVRDAGISGHEHEIASFPDPPISRPA